MKKSYWTIAIIILVIVVVFVLKGSGDSIVKKEGVNNLEVGNEESQAFLCALEYFRQLDTEEDELLSQCLGICGDYSAVLYDPLDNSVENIEDILCIDEEGNKLTQFIRLDSEGNVFQVG
jgi:hypothetical protein